MRSLPALSILVTAILISTSAFAESWTPLASTGVIEITTIDEDGDTRETKVWIVVLDDAAFVRTNGSRWLANIRRGSPVVLSLDDHTWPVTAREIDDPEIYDRVEAAFKTKYGSMQKIMSFFRISTPTLLRLELTKSETIQTPATP